MAGDAAGGNLLHILYFICSALGGVPALDSNGGGLWFYLKCSAVGGAPALHADMAGECCCCFTSYSICNALGGVHQPYADMARDKGVLCVVLRCCELLYI